MSNEEFLGPKGVALVEAEIASLRRELKDIKTALRNVFPHFENAPVTPETIIQIGREYLRMQQDPGPKEFYFNDQDGNERKIVYSPGDYSAGIFAGWQIPEDADWEVKLIS